MSPKLTELVNNNITDKNTVHSYLDTYQTLFEPRRDSARNVIEIGIYEGGSIKLWADFFNQANVHGVDINDAPTWLAKLDRVACHKTNAYVPEFVSSLPDLDVIIDDGPHTLDSMLFVAEHYTKRLAPGGVLVIEDIQQMDWTDRIIAHFPEEVRHKARVIDLRDIKGRYDDILVVLEV